MMANRGHSWCVIALQLAPTGANMLQRSVVTAMGSHIKNGGGSLLAHKFPKLASNTAPHSSCDSAVMETTAYEEQMRNEGNTVNLQNLFKDFTKN